MHSLTLSLISAVVLVATAVQAADYYQQGTKGGYQAPTKSAYQPPSKGGNSYQAPAKGYQAPAKGYQAPAKGGYEPQQQTKGGATKGQGLKGLLKPQAAPTKAAQAPEPSKTVYKAPSKTSKPQAPVEQQKIEQQTQQQEEEPIEQQTQQQQEIITQQDEQKIEQQPQQQKESKGGPKGILKWEQRLEPTQQKESYVPRKAILRPQVLEVQQKVQQTVQQEEDTQQQQQQQQEQLPVKQATEPKILLSLAPASPKLEPQPLLVQNVHQVPVAGWDAGWE